MTRRRLLLVACCWPLAIAVLGTATTQRARAEEALIAVAANFTSVAAALKASFEGTSPHRVTLASGSTGKLYAQIVNGAPFDAFLAADEARPELLVSQGFAVAESRFTFAAGRLGIWIPGSIVDADPTDQLHRLNRMAIANPELAPYGAAAMRVIQRLGLEDALANSLAMGENVAQAYAMVASGAAEGGLVAWSHLRDRGHEAESLLVPADWHPPIRQDAVLLAHGRHNAAALGFLDYLQSEPARAIIRERGYPTD